MTNEVRFNRDEYAKNYYKHYYQQNKEKLNEARKKRITINRIETLYGVKLDDDLYAMYNENRELYNKVFRQLKVLRGQHTAYNEVLHTNTNINPLLVEHFNTHIHL